MSRLIPHEEEAEDAVQGREALRQAFENDPPLHAWVIMNGRPGLHYIDLKIIAVLEGEQGTRGRQIARFN